MSYKRVTYTIAWFSSSCNLQFVLAGGVSETRDKQGEYEGKGPSSSGVSRRCQGIMSDGAVCDCDTRPRVLRKRISRGVQCEKQRKLMQAMKNNFYLLLLLKIKFFEQNCNFSTFRLLSCFRKPVKKKTNSKKAKPIHKTTQKSDTTKALTSQKVIPEVKDSKSGELKATGNEGIKGYKDKQASSAADDQQVNATIENEGKGDTMEGPQGTADAQK